MSNPTNNLIELRRHYESIIAQSEYQASQAKTQLEHIDALLLNGLLQGEMQTLNAVIASDLPALTAAPTSAPALDDRTAAELAEDVEDFLARAKPSRSSKARADSAQEPIAQGNHVPRALLPAYQGLKRLEAIAQVLQITPGQEVTIDDLISALFGNLSTTERKAEQKRLKTLLYQGEKQKKWQKGTTPSSYVIGVPGTSKTTQPAATEPSTIPAPKSSRTKTKSEAASERRLTLSLLPEYEGLNKLEAIQKVLTEQSGHILHQDTIFQLLYGDVSSELLNEESRRMRASLFQGVTKGLWKKASNQPSSYLANSSNGRKAKTVEKKNTQEIAPTKTASRGRTQVLSLPAQYAGLSKIETVAKVLEENNGKVMHMDEIIEQLYGKLSGDDLKAEKVRMKDVMTRGVQRQLWNKAQGVPSSIVGGETKQPRVAKEKSPATAKTTKPKAMAKKSQKAVSDTATTKPKRKTAEVVALLRKANIKV